MNSIASTLPIRETILPTGQEEVAAAVRSAAADATAVYPIGGATSLDFGLPAKREGVGLSLAAMNRVVDYPARDMTITVEAGMAIADLANTLAEHRQFLPFDVPHAEIATIGGVVATNWNGPRRYGYGAVRDHVIGVHAVDGTGRAFKGGGRVVKNVAGYDFCKLLTGSLGTLGVVTQVTLKLKPMPPRSAFLAAAVRNLEQAENLLAALSRSSVTPVAIELLAGPRWRDDPHVGPLLGESEQRRYVLAVALEGTESEVK
ncbi:MAG: FAD-binding oxidoreductase, partial [Planctomycetales bacterium]|nr:FAD-binding oxidoreductase [Planctomycetales bacterium]